MRIKKAEKIALVISLIAGVSLGLYLAFGSKASEPDPSAPLMSVETDHSDEALLQIPLAQTAEFRQEFILEYQKRSGFQIRDMYEKWIGTIGANGIVHSLNEVNPTCHDKAHDFGKVLYAQIDEIGPALRACDEVCYSGCMHGVFMEAFGSTGPSQEDIDRLGEFATDDHIDPDNIINEVQEACGEGGEGDSYKVGDCIHGVGHAFMFLNDYDIDAAMDDCSKLDSAPKEYYCATGAYMEFMNSLTSEQRIGEDLFYPCDEVDYPAACFRYKLPQSISRYYKQGGIFEDLVDQCLALEGKYRTACFHGIGNSHGGFVRSGQITLEKICAFGSDADQYVCIEGLQERMARHHVLLRQTPKQLYFDHPSMN